MYNKIKEMVLEAEARHDMRRNESLEIRIVLNEKDEAELLDDLSSISFGMKESLKTLSKTMRISAVNVHGKECKVYRSVNGGSYMVVGNMALVPTYKTYGTKTYNTGSELKWQTAEKIQL